MPPKKPQEPATPADPAALDAEAEAKYAPAAPKEKKGKYVAPVEPAGGVVETPQERLARFLKSPQNKGFERDHPAAAITPAGNMVSVYPRIVTGLITFDLMFGGGLPTGVQHHWFGDKASGKTTLALHTLACAQRLCSVCYRALATPGGCCDKPRALIAGYIDVEGSIDWTWAEQLGVVKADLLYTRPWTSEMTADAYEAQLSSGEVDILVVDSLAAMVPQGELDKSAAEFEVGTHARHVHRMVRKTYSLLNQSAMKTGRRPTPIFLNQNRMKVGVMFGNPETQSGGSGPGYGAGVEIRFSPAKHQKDSADPSGRPLYVTINPKIVKSKVSPSKGAEAEFSFMQKDTPNAKVGAVFDAPQLIDLGAKAGLVEGNAPAVSALGRTFRGKSVMELELVKDPAFAAELRAAILKVMAA